MLKPSGSDVLEKVISLSALTLLLVPSMKLPVTSVTTLLKSIEAAKPSVKLPETACESILIFMPVRTSDKITIFTV